MSDLCLMASFHSRLRLNGEFKALAFSEVMLMAIMGSCPSEPKGGKDDTC